MLGWRCPQHAWKGQAVRQSWCLLLMSHGCLASTGGVVTAGGRLRSRSGGQVRRLVRVRSSAAVWVGRAAAEQRALQILPLWSSSAVPAASWVVHALWLPELRRNLISGGAAFKPQRAQVLHPQRRNRATPNA